MRGEEKYSFLISGCAMGSPPHARGREKVRCLVSKPSRITPACAGKSQGLSAQRHPKRDHPRMRGEEGSVRRFFHHPAGSPPHARGRVHLVNVVVLQVGITPACAGKSRRGGHKGYNTRDHPRMRGEEFVTATPKAGTPGSPPHARGRGVSGGGLPASRGITPACAGKSSMLRIMRSR